MLGDIWNNKEWLFSGIGVVFLLWLLGVFKYLFNLLRFGISQPKILFHKLRKLKFWGVSWDFTGYFLGMSAKAGANIHISSLQVRGKNNTNNPFEKVSGYIQSNITNKRIPILLESMPPEETNGIPPKCQFWIRALFRDPNAEREGIAAENFLKEFSSFTFVFEYDGKEYKYRFDRKEVETQIELFRKDSNPKPSPMVTRREN